MSIAAKLCISTHLKTIFESNALQEEVVCSILEHTTEHGHCWEGTNPRRDAEE